ncbi:hypothetical protein SCLARK_00647 [Spiroplasma clarkii]|nr:hypothetical protein SCLARK_00647 [Spiroplasma clarkii]
MNNTTIGFNKFMTQLIGKTDYVNMKKAAVNDLIGSVLSIIVIFIIICLFTSIIVIYLITDMFVGKYKVFMNYMRIQGYSLQEVNAIIIWIFLPLTILACSLGFGLVLLTVYTIIPAALISLNIAVPLMLNWFMFPIIFAAVLAIFGTAYGIIIREMSKVNLAMMMG